MRKKKTPRLPNGYGSIRKLSGSRRNKYGVYPPQLEEDINGHRKSVPALCYVSTWTAGLAVLTAYHAGEYVPGMELNYDYAEPTGPEIDAISSILADYAKVRRAAGKRAQEAAGPTFKEVYERYYADKFESGKEYSRSATAAATAAFKNCRALHDLPLASITVDDLQDVIDKCTLKHSSLEFILALFRGVYKYALSRDMVSKDLSHFVKIKTPEDDEHGVPFTDDELRVLWNHQGDPVIELVLIMCYAGYRISAYQSMIVNLEEGYFLGGNKTRSGKNLQTPIHSAILPIVTRRIRRDGCLLSVTPGRFRVLMYGTLEAIGMDRHTPHDCKHTFSRLCEKYGVNENDRKRLLGHKIGNVTNDVYGHRTLEELRAEIEKIKVNVESVSKAGQN